MVSSDLSNYLNQSITEIKDLLSIVQKENQSAQEEVILLFRKISY